jgi:plasmid stabilization system protein ParE
MSLWLERAEGFEADFAREALYYVREAGPDFGRRLHRAVEATLKQLCRQPDLGRIRRFRHPLVRGLRSFRIDPPFNKVPIFYRTHGEILQAVRLMHGSRDLPRRLIEPPVPNLE